MPVHSLAEMSQRGWGVVRQADGSLKLVSDVDISPDELARLQEAGYMAIEEQGTYRLLGPEEARKAFAKEYQLHFLGIPVSFLLVVTVILLLYEMVCGW